MRKKDRAKLIDAAARFAVGHDEVVPERRFGQYCAFYVHDKANDGCKVGLPLYVLVDEYQHCRWATDEESLEIMGLSE